jgi:hypothetical protein
METLAQELATLHSVHFYLGNHAGAISHSGRFGAWSRNFLEQTRARSL